jgi:hypothetical protein
MSTIGRVRWVIPEGYLPAIGPFSNDRALRSHEAACILNAGDRDAHLRIHIYFRDREPAGPYHCTVPARRTLHLRFDDLRDPEPVPRETDYSSLFESDEPVVVQHTRLDARESVRSLMSTTAYGQD